LISRREGVEKRQEPKKLFRVSVYGIQIGNGPLKLGR
jgi:hypothetical protein